MSSMRAVRRRRAWLGHAGCPPPGSLPWAGLLGLSLLLALLGPRLGTAQVAYDNASGASCTFGTCTSGNTVLQYSHTTGSGSQRGIVVGACVSYNGGTAPTIASVTYGALTLTSKHTVTVSTTHYCQYFSNPDGQEPASGANNVTLTLALAFTNGNGRFNSAAITVTGVDATTAWTSTTNGASGTGTSATMTLSASGAQDLGVHFACNGTSVSTTVGADETSRFIGTTDTNGPCNTFGAATALGGDTSFSRTVGNDSWIIIGGAWKAATGGTPTPPRRKPIILN